VKSFEAAGRSGSVPIALGVTAVSARPLARSCWRPLRQHDNDIAAADRPNDNLPAVLRWMRFRAAPGVWWALTVVYLTLLAEAQ
jgi:hypothetical protein